MKTAMSTTSLNRIVITALALILLLSYFEYTLIQTILFKEDEVNHLTPVTTRSPAVSVSRLTDGLTVGKMRKYILDKCPVVPAQKNNSKTTTTAICMFGEFRFNKFMYETLDRFVLHFLDRPDIFLFLVLPSTTAELTVWQRRLVSLATGVVLETEERFNSMIGSSASCHGTTTMHQLYAASRCGEMLRASERHAREGIAYERVILTRPDHVYRAIHPSLQSLDPAVAWVPKGEDYAGLNDRHMVMRRDHADVRFGAYGMVLNKTLPWCVQGGHKAFLKTLLARHKVPVRRYPAVSYISCSERCTNTSSIGGPKHDSEYRDVMDNMDKFERRWAVLELAKASAMAMECYKSILMWD